jgi:hypothetical protein
MTDTADTTPVSGMDRPRPDQGGRGWLTGLLLVAAVVLCWILATPLSGGPDEPAHLIRGGALVRGDLDGAPSELPGLRVYELPAWLAHPDPACFALQPFNPVTCATSVPRPEGEGLVASSAGDYQVWGHLLPGIGTLLPAEVGGWAARLLDAAIPVAVVTVALSVLARRSRTAFAAGLLAVTPMAWFMFAVVNPSGLVIAGGLGLWVALGAGVRPGGPADLDLRPWLAAASWALLTLPRRDGLLWAVLILSLSMLLSGVSLPRLLGSLGRGPLVLGAAATVATMIWGATSDSPSAQSLVLLPVIPVLVELGRRVWTASWMAPTWRRAVAVGASLPAVVMAAYLVMDRRAAGYDADVMRLVVGRTGTHLDEAIGVLGWLDAPLPTGFLYLWLIGLGILAALAVSAGSWARLVAATSIALIGIAASWVLEMAQNDPTGTYWQGRYGLPFLLGAAIVLGHQHVPRPSDLRIGVAVAGLAVVVLNAALVATMRRWSVGLAGSLWPWDWDTYDAPLPPIVLIVAHAAATIGLVMWGIGLRRRSRAAPGPSAAR